MKKSIAVLGSTGSIGSTTLKVINQNHKLFNIQILAANSNYKKICDQIKKFKPSIFIISNKKILFKIKKKFKKNKKIYLINKFSEIPANIKKIDITISAIPGISGLDSTLRFIKISNKMLLANKESVICGWQLIHKEAKKNKTKILPLDSEHFSIHQLLKGIHSSEIHKIYITASGGPFLNLPYNKFSQITYRQALKHPKWSMGKKISIDSATMMNKILELIEAKKIFNLDYSKFEIIIHPQSLVHAIVEFKNGISKFLYHEPNMIIPISNALLDTRIDIRKLINYKPKKNLPKYLNFIPVDKRRFPVINLIPILNKHKSTPIIINAINEILVDQFINKKICFNSINKYLFKVLKDKNYKKYAIQSPNNLKHIYKIDQWARKTTFKIINESNI
jgi:1-deoxy-D-xylulose-5-phosphate reductoisomerase|tara:strand:- start:149 stop:1327 length:1179 start_codon:yes stop_codon:yes gene_type:complete